MPATMNDVARLADVSLKTVSNYFNDYPSMRPETRARIGAAVDELGYRVNLSARRLRTRRTGMISLIVPELDQAFFAELAQEVIAVAREHDLTVLVETTGGDRDRELQAISGERRHLIDGAIIDPLAIGPSDAPQLAGEPLVIIGERQFEGLADHVLIADEGVAKRATEHLLEIGRRRILVLGPGGAVATHTSALRLRGFQAAMAEAGLPLVDALLAPTDAWSRDAGAAAAVAALEAGARDPAVRFDAVLGFNDALALGAQWALLQRGVDVPGDVAVIGIDDTRDARFAHPTLTTMSPGSSQIARRAVELLVARIKDPSPALGFASIVADYELVVRQSTGVARPPRPLP